MPLDREQTALLEWSNTVSKSGPALPADELDELRQWADQVSAEKRNRLKPLYGDATKMLHSLGDASKAVPLLRSIPKAKRDDLVDAMTEVARETFEGTPRPGFTTRISESFAGGVNVPFDPIEEWGQDVTADEADTLGRLRDIADSAQSPSLKSDPWYDRWAQSAASMAPFSMVAATAATQGGAAAKALGMGKAMQTTATVAAGAAAGTPTEAKESYRMLRDAGVDQELASGLAPAIGAMVATTEMIVPDPFKESKPGLARGIVRGAISDAWEVAKRIPGETSEEFFQRLEQDIATSVATRLDTEAPDQGFGQAFPNALRQAAESAGPIALMMGAPAAARAPRNALVRWATSGQTVGQIHDRVKAGGNVSRKEARDFGFDPEVVADKKARTQKFVDEIVPILEGANVPQTAPLVPAGGERGAVVEGEDADAAAPGATGAGPLAGPEAAVPPSLPPGFAPPSFNASESQGRAGLPNLKPGFVRVVHIGAPGKEESFRTGLDYSRQGILQSTAVVFGNEQEAQYTNDDPRFARGTAYVYDVPESEIRQHMTVSAAPGLIDGKYFVGSVPPAPPADSVSSEPPAPTLAPEPREGQPTSEVPPGATQTAPESTLGQVPGTTSIKNAKMAELAAQIGLEPVEDAPRQSVQQWLDEATQRMTADPAYGEKLVLKQLGKPGSLTRSRQPRIRSSSGSGRTISTKSWAGSSRRQATRLRRRKLARNWRSPKHGSTN
jgi:hypothetical protein